MSENKAVAVQGQFPLPWALDDEAQKVFTATEIKARQKDGSETVVGARLKLNKAAEVAELMGLQPKKDAETILERKHEIKRRMLVVFKQWLAGTDDSWMLERAAARMVKGRKSLTINMIEEPLPKIDFERLAKAWFTHAQFPDMTDEEKIERVKAMYRDQVEALAKQQAENTIDAESTKTSAD